ncbi:MAG: SIMPL domain-containing protein [Parcubacteria group bacterium]
MPKNNFIIPVAIFSAAIIVGTLIIGGTFYKVKSLSDLISVTGSAQKNITSDVVKWQASFSRNTGADGLRQGNTQIKSDLDAVLKFLKDNGVEDKDITVFPVSINPVYEQMEGKYYYGGGGVISGYNLSQNIKVESNKVQEITDLANNTGPIVDQGILFSSQPLEYYYSKIADLKVEMLAEATKDARARAEKIAESAGSRLGDIRAASMGVMQITPPNSTEISDYGYYDTTSIEKQINAIVRASFSLR